MAVVVLGVFSCGERRHHPKPAPSSYSGDIPPTTPMVVTLDSAAPIPPDRPASYEPSPPTTPSDEQLAKVPTQEDYEARAEKDITPRNARAELVSLDREISK
jgi:hypothetical protein